MPLRFGSARRPSGRGSHPRFCWFFPREIAQAQFLDLYRASLKTATDFMKTSLEQTERFQQQQLQMVKSALEESSRSGNQASEVKSLDDIVALNSKLAGNQLERVASSGATGGALRATPRSR